MAFTYDLSTDLGRVRFKLRDVRPEQPFFQDAEITYLLTDGGSVDGAVLAGARVMLMEIARYARSYSTSISDGGTSDVREGRELRHPVCLLHVHVLASAATQRRRR